MTHPHAPRSVDAIALLERAPLSGIQRRVLILATLTIVLEGFDIQLVAFAGPSILGEWGIARSSLGMVMAAALVGMVFGASGGGVLGDRLGRRKTLIGSTAVFALATLISAVCRDLTQLTVLRAVAGLGFGAALPCATALVAEFMPARIRAQSVAVVVVGVPCGGMIGAALASWLVPTFGWRSVFIVGGSLPLLLAGTMLFALPESLRFLLRDGRCRAQAIELLRKISGSNIHPSAQILVTEEGANTTTRTDGAIFTREFARSNFGLWLAFFASLACGYAFFSWIPTALSAMDLPLGTAMQGSFYFNLFGVVGSLAGAWVATQMGSRSALLILLSIGIGATLALGVWLIYVAGAGLPVQSAYIMAALSLAGLSNSGAQASLYSLAAHIYPTRCRVTGIGWAAGIGRVGAIGSAYGGGAVLSLSVGPGAFFITLGLLLGLTAVGVVIVDRHTAPLRSRYVSAES